jgi:hypothetical protein
MLVAVTLVGIIAHWWFTEPVVWLSSSSPNHTYKVELTGDKGRGGFFIPAVVKYTLIKNGHLLAKNRKAHSGDAMDISFELAYPEYTWINENVMRFWRKTSEVIDNRSNTIRISNVANKAVKYMFLKTKDMFFIFDIQPHSTLRLSFTRQSEGTGIWCEGEFDDRSRFEYGAGYPESKMSEQSAYCMTIHDDQITIESRRERGYDHKGSLNKLNIPASAGCNP